MNSARSWVVFAGACFTYLVAVAQRTTFGVAGVEATDRFDVSASAISTVAVVQIVVYAALQIPVGVLADRIGPRVLIVVGAVLMGLGQLALALTETYGWALVARIVVGAGDAATFVSVIRLLPGWFEGPLLPQLSQWVGMIGQLGQIVSAFPFALLLHEAGWSPAFAAAAAVGLVSAVSALALLRRGAPSLSTRELAAIDPSETGLRASLARPGTRLGFWAHLLAGTLPTMLGILWGYPFLTGGLDYPPAAASAVFSAVVVGGLVSGPIVGVLIARHPLRRSDVVLAMSWAAVLAGAAMLLWQPVPPVWLVTLFFLLVGAGGPASLVGLDLARTFNPGHAHGSATGVANSGGFVGGFLAMLMVGAALDLVDRARVAAGEPSDLYSLTGFRVAFATVSVVILAGTVAVLWIRGRTRRRMEAEQGITIAPLWVALFGAHVRRRSRGMRQ